MQPIRLSGLLVSIVQESFELVFQLGKSVSSWKKQI